MNLYSIDGKSIPAPSVAKALKEFEKKYGKGAKFAPQLVHGTEPPAPKIDFSNIFGDIFGATAK